MSIKSINVNTVNDIKDALDEARKAVLSGDFSEVQVIFAEGEYNIEQIYLNDQNSGTKSCPIRFIADGKAVFSGGKALPYGDFEPVSGEAHERLSDEAQEKVLQYDLKAHGITRDEVGEFGAMMTFASTVKMYDDYKDGINAELFWNNERMTIARYPNNGTVAIVDVCDIGDCGEYPPQNYDMEFYSRRNPRGFTIYVDKNTNSRIANWREPQKAWINGWFFWDWADASSQIDYVEPRIRRITTKHATAYGVRKGAPIFFVNILEELDSPGEFYIDRDQMMLYIYPKTESKAPRITLSLSEKPLLLAENVEYISFEGFTFECTRSDAIRLTGNNCRFNKCSIRNVALKAMKITGYNNIIENCDISRTGTAGIIIDGGNRETLTRGNNIARNNYIHDWSEIAATYTPGIALHGCGNTASHNEFYNAPHAAIIYHGNYQTIEYNYLHEVVLHSNDAGTIYAGRDMAAYGNVVRYNYLKNIGSSEYHPFGIYWDDSLSGQKAYGNILDNVGGSAFLIGGGRDNYVTENIIITSDHAIHYDSRGREAILFNGWYSAARERSGGIWSTLDIFKRNKDIWAEHFPELCEITNDYSDVENPNFGMNPKGFIRNNILICEDNGKPFLFGDGLERFGEVEGNLVFASKEECLNADYEPKPEVLERIKEFNVIPFDKIGIQNEI